MTKSDIMKPQGLVAIAALVLSLLFALMSFPEAVFILVLLGIIIGFMSIAVQERIGFLLSALVLAILGISISTLLPTTSGFDFSFVSLFFRNLAAVATPAAVVVGLMHFWQTAKS